MSSSVEQFPKNAYFLIVTDPTMELGSYVTDGGDLTTAHIRFFHRCTGAFSYTLQLVVSSYAGGPTLTSSTVETFTDVIIGQTTSDFLGDLTFTFDGYNLLAGESYFFRLVTTGYTRTLETKYLGIGCDWLEPVGSSNTAGARMAIGVEL